MGLFFVEFEELGGELLALREDFVGESVMVRLDGVEKFFVLYLRHSDAYYLNYRIETLTLSS